MQRDWDLDESFKPIHIGIVACLGLAFLAFIIIDFLISSAILVFYTWVAVSAFLVFGILYPLLRRQDKQLTSTHKGYNQKPAERPYFWFGTVEYNRYRIDEGVMQPATMGRDPYRDKLDRLEREQRESNCEVCKEEVHEKFAPHSDPFYVVENRKLYRFIGIPYKEKILNWKAYCSEHKPEDFQ